MNPPVITIGSATKDIFLVPREITILDNEKEITRRKLMAFEYGAKLEAEELISQAGGTAINVAVGLKRRGIDAGVLCAVGDDDPGREIIKTLKKEKVDISRVKILENNSTDCSLVILDKKTGERTIFVNKKAGQELDVACFYLEGVAAVYLSSLKHAWEEKYKEVLRCVLKQKIRLFLNLGEEQIKAGIDRLRELLKETEVLFLNLDEAVEFTGQKSDINVPVIINKLLQSGPRIIIITDGENGVHVSSSEGYFHAPSQKIIPKDVTGAGDAFAAGFLAAYLKKEPLVKATEEGIENSLAVLAHLGTL